MYIIKQIKILFLLLLCLFMPFCALASGETVRVGWYLVDGLQNYDSETDEYSGYNYDYLKAISQITGWKYEFVHMSFNDCMTALKSGDIDIVGGLARIPEREKEYLYPVNNVGNAGPRLVTLKSNSKYAFEGIQDFNGMRVGIYGQGNINKVLATYAKNNNLDIETIIYPSQTEQLTALKNGDIDAIIVSGTMRLHGMRLLVQMPQQEIYFVTSPGKTWIRDGLDQSITRIKYYDSNFSDELKSHYFSASGIPSVSFTKEEQDYIRQRIAEGRPVLVAYDPAWAPIEYRDPNTGEMKGIMQGIFQLLAKHTGLQFQFVAADTYSETVKQYGNQAELYTALAYDYDWGDRHNAYLTRPVFDVQIFSVFQADRKNYNIVALPTGYHLVKSVREWCKEENNQYVYYDTMDECVDAVCSGNAGRTFINAYELNYYMDKFRLAQVTIQSESGFTQKTSIGIMKSADPLLFSIISRTLRSIPQGEIDSEITTYSQNHHALGFKDYVYANPFKAIVASCFLLLLVASLAFFYYSSRKNKQQRYALERANNAKSEFLSKMSHDIRTPMNAIMGMTALANQANESKQVRDYLNKIDTSSKFLLELINDILDMSRIEQGHIELHPEPYDLKEFEMLINGTVRVLTEKKTIHFYYEEDPMLPRILVDHLRFNQVFLNLLSNAVKFTPQDGTVRLSMKQLSKEGTHVRLQIAIRDTGVGISEKFLPHLFDPFAQENERHISAQEGSGLGLAIVKRLIDTMQGTIQVHSEKGKGSEFVVVLPVEICDLPVPKAKPLDSFGDVSLQGKSILIVEDNEINQEVVQQILNHYGLQTDIANNGLEALEKFQASRPGDYDAILMDIRMPVMDGREATKRIRALERPDARKIPIIALTADAYSEDRSISMASGMDGYLAKPIAPEMLYKALARVLK